MPRPQFDVVLTIGGAQLAGAGLSGRREAAAHAARSAIQTNPGAAVIDIEVVEHPIPARFGMATVYQHGRSVIPNTPDWRRLRSQIEEAGMRALVDAGARPG